MSSDQDEPSEGASNCPACGYFVGGASECPRCGSEAENSTAISMAKLIAVVGSIVGIIFLWGYTKYVHDIPSIQISEINEAMNGALVSIEGRVTGVQINEADNSFTINVSQGVDEISLRAFDDLKSFRRELGDDFPPHFFDKVRVTSSINIHPQFGASMFLSMPDRFQVVESWNQAKVYSPADFTLDDVGSYYLTEGTVKGVKKPGRLRVVKLSDYGEQRELTIRDSQYDKLSSEVKSAVTTAGSRLRLVVKVEEFRGNLQLALADPGTIYEVGAN